jgi:hypothetical protein
MAGPAEIASDRNSAQLKAAICQEVVRSAVRHYSGSLRAIVLTGSLARNEASFRCSEGICEVLGDAEFFLVFEGPVKLPAAASIELLRRDLEAGYARNGIALHIGLSPVRPAYFRKLPPHIFTYELRIWGEVLWGDSRILSLIPQFPAARIERADAWHLLNNRILELLEVSALLSTPEDTLPRDVSYRTVKLYLDIATSFLVFREAYEPSYADRAKAIERLAESERLCAKGPFPSLKAFSECVQHYTDLKLNGTGTRVDFNSWRQAIDCADLLWHWELQRLCGPVPQITDIDLLRCWAKRQPMLARARGWLYVLRTCGWHRSWRQWHHWVRFVWQTSPRYLTYAAGSDLLFRLPGLIDRSETWSKDLHQNVRLPLSPSAHLGQAAFERAEWRALASDIAWNYHHFLEGTVA